MAGVVEMAEWTPVFKKEDRQFKKLSPRYFTYSSAGADPGFFLGGCALVPCST